MISTICSLCVPNPWPSLCALLITDPCTRYIMYHRPLHYVCYTFWTLTLFLYTLLKPALCGHTILISAHLLFAFCIPGLCTLCLMYSLPRNFVCYIIVAHPQHLHWWITCHWHMHTELHPTTPTVCALHTPNPCTLCITHPCMLWWCALHIPDPCTLLITYPWFLHSVNYTPLTPAFWVSWIPYPCIHCLTHIWPLDSCITNTPPRSFHFINLLHLTSVLCALCTSDHCILCAMYS